MNMLADVRRRGLDLAFEDLRQQAPARPRGRHAPRGGPRSSRDAPADRSRARPAPAATAQPREPTPRIELELPDRIDVPEDELPF
jgi:hypothetical protein